jgi:energy-coupling factor transport system ATP-binding protein
MKKMICVEDLSYEYKGQDENVRALDHISFTVEPGKFVAILGHNGSGKSTLAKLLNGLLLPTEGHVIIDDMDTQDPEKIWDIRSTAGMVFQNPDNQLVATIVEEDIAFGPENLGVPQAEIQERVDRALATVEMSEFRDRAPHLLSGGQKQRIAIAGVLAMEPDCIIFDEPTAMLDPSGRREVLDTILKLNTEEKKTILLITHYMDEAILADRVLVMAKGKIVMDDVPKKIFNQVDRMKSLGLDIPQVTDLAHQLIQSGYPLSDDILSIEEMVDELCQYV